LLVDLIAKTWKVFRVSPLHNFQYTTTRMKQYGRRLQEGLANLLSDSTMDAEYDASFSVAEGLKLTEYDSEAIQVGIAHECAACSFGGPSYQAILIQVCLHNRG
jgi:hypothetical protein